MDKIETEQKGGQMACPGCGKTEHVYRDISQTIICSCSCGWIGEYEDMIFVKKVSEKGRQRGGRT